MNFGYDSNNHLSTNAIKCWSPMTRIGILHGDGADEVW